MDVAAWLEELGLVAYVTSFADNDITPELLSSLTADDLKELGVRSLGHCKKILLAIAAFESDPPDSRATMSAAVRVVPDGEKRPVTVMFADITGFTTVSGEIGAEATHELLNAYFEAVDGIVERYGGHIDKHIGDNVMAVFGVPVAHTNDPERAVRAACDVHIAMTDLSDNLSRRIQAHIGIASGEVVASGTGSDLHSEYTVTGNSVNLAARLQDVAGPGETLISESVKIDAAEAIIADARTPVHLKGIEGLVTPWRVGQLIDRDQSVRSTTKFVGRARELSELERALTACQDQGAGAVFLIRGEPGIGKSRVTAEIRDRGGASISGAICPCP